MTGPGDGSPLPEVSGWRDKRLIRVVRCSAFAAVLLPQTVQAGFEEGQSAYDRGEYEAAIREWRPVAESGDTRAQYELGLMYARGQGTPPNYLEAANAFREAAVQGHKGAQYRLGLMYFDGQGVKRDPGKAAGWFRKAADQGLREAQFYLGGMYYDGLGVAKDHRQSAEWYREAAEQGHAKAQYELGLMYARGEGVPFDMIEAYKWNRLAGNQELLEKLTAVMSSEEIREAERITSEWRSQKDGTAR